jgi:hypothetical protein
MKFALILLLLFAIPWPFRVADRWMRKQKESKR